MALSLVSPSLTKGIADTISANATNITPNNWTTDVTDSGDAEPTFDTKHEVFTNPLVDSASQNAIGDNSNGVEPTLTLKPTLSFSYSSGYTTEHEESKGFSVGVTQSFDYEFLGVGGSTTLTAQGNFDWTDSTGTNNTTTIASAVAAPFTIPAGKIFEEKLIFNQETVTVPYSWAAHVTGTLEYNNTSSGSTFSDDIGGDLRVIQQIGLPLPTLPGIDWADVTYASETQIDYALHGTLTVQGASAYTVTVYDITKGDSQAVQAEYDPLVPIGVHRIMDDAGRTFRDTPFADWVDGGSGADTIRLSSGGDIVHAAGGNDRILANGIGRGLLDGGAGDDIIRLTSTDAYGTIIGGDGDDRIRVDAPATMIYGGAGNDRYALHGATAGGTVITDAEGTNRLVIGQDAPLGFERVAHSDNLYILLGGGESYDRTRDVVWVDFFANDGNRVERLRPADIEAILAPQPPTTTEFINAANWTYGRDESSIPAGLRPFEVAGQHLTQKVTEHGFYGAAFLTSDDQVVIAFEGTHLSALDTDPVFVAAQLAADIQIYLGAAPAAYADALAFTQTVLVAAQAQGIGLDEVYLTGHSLGAAEAGFVAAQLGLPGETYGAPGIPGAAIPPGRPSLLVNYVERGDPVGNYSAEPDVLNGFVFNDNILRFGEPTYLGDPLAGAALAAAGAQFGPGTTPEQNAAGLVTLAGLASEYHVLTTYAADLGVTLEEADDSGAADLATLLASTGLSLPSAFAMAEPFFA